MSWGRLIAVVSVVVQVAPPPALASQASPSPSRRGPVLRECRKALAPALRQAKRRCLHDAKPATCAAAGSSCTAHRS